MPTARCSTCNRNFPVLLAGNDCPVCEADVLAAVRNDEPDDPEELHKAVTHARFHRYLEETGRL